MRKTPIVRNDEYIRAMLASPYYRVDVKSCEVWTLVSKQGHLTNVWRKKAVSVRKDGYKYVQFFGKKLLFHRVIYQLYYGRLRADMQVNHIDGDAGNNNPVNLEQVSPSKNQLHKFRVNGRDGVIGNYKISYEVANLIRQDRLSGMTYSELTIKYGLAKSTISYVCNGRTWRQTAAACLYGRYA